MTTALQQLSIEAVYSLFSDSPLPSWLQEAFKCYVRARDYCTTPKHISATYLNAIRVSIEQENFPHVSNYVSKAEQTPDVKVDVSAVC